MGWFFRKSAKLGPFRLNFSKSGIGVSAGIRGARISKGPRGTYLSLGSNGIYYRQKINRGYSATSRTEGTASRFHNSTPYQATSLPPELSYPVFPKHGRPRIVNTLGLLAVFSLGLLPLILAFAGLGIDRSGFSGAPRTDNSKAVARKQAVVPAESDKERGFRTGFDYALRTTEKHRGKKLLQRRIKQIAAQMASNEQEGEEWQQGWIEGYARGSDKSIVPNGNDNKGARKQFNSPAISPSTFQQTSRSSSNRYVRGPRGGCYYFSASGRKVYVSRELCN